MIETYPTKKLIAWTCNVSSASDRVFVGDIHGPWGRTSAVWFIVTSPTKRKNQNYSKILFLCEIVLVTISRDSSDFNSYSKGMHRRLCKQVNWSDWQVTGGQSGGSSLPSRQSGEKSHFHLRGMHFWPSAHWKTSGSLQSKLTSRRWPCTIAKDNNRVINLIMIMLRSWIRETFLQTEMSALTH